MPLIFRLVKGTPLTFLEGDNNLRHLEGLAVSSSNNFNNWTGSALSQFAGTSSFATTASYALNAESGLSGGTQYYLPVWTGASTLGTSSLYDDSSVLKSVYNGNDVGLKLDFEVGSYILGETNHNISIYSGSEETYIINKYIEQSDPSGTNKFIVDGFNNVIKTQYQNNDIGLKLDFANNNYTLGTPNIKYNVDDLGNLGGNANLYFNTAGTDNGIGVSILDTTTAALNYVWLGDYNNTGNGTSLRIDDLVGSSNIRTLYQGNDIGLKLDFASSKYELGQLTGGNQTKLIIDDATQTIAVTGSLNAPIITGSLEGTASWATTASWAPPSSFIITGSVSASVNTIGSIFTVASSSVNLLTVSNSGVLVVASSASLALGRSVQITPSTDGGSISAFSLLLESASPLRLRTTTANALLLATSGLDRWYIEPTGQLTTATDNVHDIGLSGSRRPRNIYAAGTGSVFAALDITFGSTNALKTFPSTGNVFIGSTPTDGGFKLDVNGSTRFGSSNQMTVQSTGQVDIKNGLTITGSATITDVLTLPYQDPLPSSPATGSIALSGSGATFVGMFVWTGVWTQI